MKGISNYVFEKKVIPCIKKGELLKAEYFLKDAIELNIPGWGEDYLVYSYCNVLVNHSYFDQAISIIEKYLNEHNSELSYDLNSRFYELLGLIAKLNDDNQKAILNYEKAFKINPYSYFALVQKAVLLSERGNIHDALENISKAKKIIKLSEKFDYNDDDLIVILESEAEILENNSKYSQAIECFNEILNINPLDSFYLYQKGRLLIELELFDIAAVTFENALKIDASDLNCKFKLLICYYNLGKNTLSKKLLNEIIKENNEYKEIIMDSDEFDKNFKNNLLL